VAGWTLPLLLGVHRVEVMQPIETPLRRAADAAEAVAGFPGGEAGLATTDSDDWAELLAHLAKGETGAIGFAGEAEGHLALGPGESDDEWITVEGMPRIGLYTPWSGVMNEGWLRWVFDEFGIPYVRVRNEMIRAGELGDFLDVLVLPSISAPYLDAGRLPGTVPAEFAGGLDPEGAVAVEEFVRGGGRLIAIERSARWAAELVDLPLVDVTEASSEFSCPGSVLRTTPADSPFVAGIGESLPVFFSSSAAWRVRDEDDERPPHRAASEVEIETLLRYSPTRVLYSGWIREPETIAGRSAWVRARHGDGEVHLFGFRPQYRGWSQAAFQLLFRAILVSHDEPK
jgi:hypothetical protein